MGLFSSKKKTETDPQPIRRDLVRRALKLGMTWYEGDPDGRDFVANRDRYYRAQEKCTPEEVAYVEAALERHGYPP